MLAVSVRIGASDVVGPLRRKLSLWGHVGKTVGTAVFNKIQW